MMELLNTSEDSGMKKHKTPLLVDKIGVHSIVCEFYAEKHALKYNLFSARKTNKQTNSENISAKSMLVPIKAQKNSKNKIKICLVWEDAYYPNNVLNKYIAVLTVTFVQ